MSLVIRGTPRAGEGVGMSQTLASKGEGSRDRRLMSEGEAARLLDCSEASLRRWRRQGRAPRCVKMARLVRYDPTDLEEFIERHKDRPAPRRGPHALCS